MTISRVEEENIQELLKNNKRPLPRFFLEFNFFATFDRRIEASFVVTPNFELEAVEETYFDGGKVRGLTLVFHERELPQPGRRGFSLKKEWEVSKNGEVTLDSQTNETKEMQKP